MILILPETKIINIPAISYTIKRLQEIKKGKKVDKK